MVAPTLPVGMVTFPFTDIEGSTVLWERQPGPMGRALERHDDLLGAVIARHGGHVFSRAGDAFAAVFVDPADAAAAALEGQRLLSEETWPEGAVIRVRMGVHTGVAQLRGGDYFGPSVNRAARIASAAHGGQIMASSATAELVRGRLPPFAGLVSVGDLRLRGFAGAEQVFQLSDSRSESSFPPPRADRVHANLPRNPTVFVGRAAALDELVAVVANEKLLTLTGPGGTGKTRRRPRARRSGRTSVRRRCRVLPTGIGPHGRGGGRRDGDCVGGRPGGSGRSRGCDRGRRLNAPHAARAGQLRTRHRDRRGRGRRAR